MQHRGFCAFKVFLMRLTWEMEKNVALELLLFMCNIMGERGWVGYFWQWHLQNWLSLRTLRNLSSSWSGVVYKPVNLLGIGMWDLGPVLWYMGVINGSEWLLNRSTLYKQEEARVASCPVLLGSTTPRVPPCYKVRHSSILGLTSSIFPFHYVWRSSREKAHYA